MHLIDAPLAQTALPARTRKPNSAGRVTVGDIKMYYEVHGQGEPLAPDHGPGRPLS